MYLSSTWREFDPIQPMWSAYPYTLAFPDMVSIGPCFSCYGIHMPFYHWQVWKHKLHILSCFNLLRPRQNGRHFSDDIFKCTCLNENVWIPIKISLKFVPKGPINNIPALVQIMAWRRPGDKPLSAPMMVSLLTHICVTRPQWVINIRSW